MVNAYDIQNDELLKQWKNGDQPAFARFCNKHFIELVNTAAKKLNSRELAEEITQDALLSLYESKTVEYDPLAFCYGILKNKITDYYRRTKLTTVEQASLDVTFGEVGGAGHRLEYQELEGQIAAHIQDLPEQARAVFLLRREGNLSNRQVAEKLSISERTVEAHMRKALAVLKNKIAKTAYVSLLVWTCV